MAKKEGYVDGSETKAFSFQKNNVTLTLTCPTNKLACSSWTVKFVGMVRLNTGSLSLTSVTTMFTVVVDV